VEKLCMFERTAKKTAEQGLKKNSNLAQKKFAAL
jgi:hypothetical protein